MNTVTKKVKVGGYLTNWLVSAPSQKELVTKEVIIETDQEFSEEHVDVVYPLRREFLRKRVAKDSFPQGDKRTIYFPFENKRVEFSAMIKTPFHLEATAESIISVAEEGVYQFELVTCGGVVIWLNDEKVTEFLPFTRNNASKTTLSVKLKQGDNYLQVYFEDLAERDVYFYFQMRLIGLPENVSHIDQRIATEITQQEYGHVTKFIDSISFTKDEYLAGDILVKHDHNDRDKELFIRINHSYFKDPVLEKVHLLPFEVKHRRGADAVSIGASETRLFSVAEIASGTKNIELGIKLSNGQIAYKRFCISVYNNENLNLIFPENLEDRKQMMLALLAESENEDITKALARLAATGECDAYTKALILDGLKIINERGDCADFRTAPLLIIVMRYAALLDSETLMAIQQAFLGFRYWIDEPGNDTMWYFSENHALLFHLTQYLAGGLYPDELFTASQRTGAEQKELGRQRLVQWFEEFEKYGFSEWNSTTYIPVDLIGFFTLYLLDDHFYPQVKKALDFSFEIIASHLLNDVFGSTYGRVYEKELKGFKCGEMASIIKMAWNKGYFNHHNRVLVPFALSDYAALPLPFSEQDGQGVEYRYCQGRKAKINSFKTQDYLLSTVEHFAPFEHGHQQHTFNLLIGAEQVPMWINHPGEFVLSGENRPSYWAGNGILPDIYQHRNLALIQYELKGSEIDFTHVYLPVGSYQERLTFDKGFAVVFSETIVMFYTDAPYEFMSEGATEGREVKIYGQQQRILVKVLAKREAVASDLQEYFEAYGQLVNLNAMKVVDPQWGTIDMGSNVYRYTDPVAGSMSIDVPMIDAPIEWRITN